VLLNRLLIAAIETADEAIVDQLGKRSLTGFIPQQAALGGRDGSHGSCQSGAVRLGSRSYNRGDAMKLKNVTFAILSASLTFAAVGSAPAQTVDDVNWINKCVADNKDEGQARPVLVVVLHVHEQSHVQ
jgi:hypothetical protein